MENRAKTKKHWLIVIIISLMYMGSLGLVQNTIGVYYAPVSEDLGILTGTFSMNATIAMLFTAVTSLFVPRLLERWGWKRTILTGAILCATGMMGMGLTRSVFIFNLLGAIRGVGVALSAMLPGAAIINNWFYEKNGLALSIGTASSGVVTVIFSPIFQRLIETIGWERTFFVHGFLIILLFIPAIFVPYQFKPEDEGLLPYGSKDSTELSGTQEPLQEPVRTSDYIGVTFFALVGVAFLQTFATGLSQHLPTYSLSLGAAPTIASFTLSAVMIGNVSTKLIIGHLSDRIGVVKSIIIFACINIFALILLYTWTSDSGLIIASLIYGTAYAGGVSHVVMTKEFFGTRISNYVNAPIVFVASSAGAIGNAVIGYFYDFAGTYAPMFLVIIVFQLVTMLLLFIARKHSLQFNP